MSIHPLACIDPKAQLGENVEIGPFCVVGPDARIGDGTQLVSNVVVDGHTTLGRDCIVHPHARIGGKTQDLKYAGGTTYVEVGDRTVLRECVSVNCGTRDGEVTRIGSDCLLMAYCHAAHGVEIGNGVIVSNGTQFAGEVKIEDKAVISGLVGVHQFVRIGTMCMIGGVQKITQDVPPYMLVDSLNGRATVVGINKVGLERRGVPEESRQALRQAHRLLCRSGLNVSEALARIEAELPPLPEILHLVEFFRTTQRGVMH
jgi:UDP-N-acetylglucosamine acyltransferase